MTMPPPLPSRRALLRQTACGFGAIALRAMLAAEENENPLAPKAPHFPARAQPRVLANGISSASVHAMWF